MGEPAGIAPYLFGSVASPHTHTPPRKHRSVTSAIHAPDPRVDPLVAARMFAPHSSLFSACLLAKFPDSDLSNFATNALSNRRRRSRTRAKVLRFVLEFHDFSVSRSDPAPIAGPESAVAISCWLEVLSSRGPAVPPMARYSLVVFTEALGVDMPPKRPEVTQWAKLRKPPTRHAPPASWEFIPKLEIEAVNNTNPEGRRV